MLFISYGIIKTLICLEHDVVQFVQCLQIPKDAVMLRAALGSNLIDRRRPPVALGVLTAEPQHLLAPVCQSRAFIRFRCGMDGCLIIQSLNFAI
jgi:hypothetical protein